MSKQKHKGQNKQGNNPGTKPTSNSAMKSKTATPRKTKPELKPENKPETKPETKPEDKSKTKPEEPQYTNEEFEEFLQQAELAGISRKRQDELITMFLAESVPLDAILLNSIQSFVKTMKSYRIPILVLVLALGLSSFVIVSGHRARYGYQEWQPWQIEMGAKLKTWQLQVR